MKRLGRFASAASVAVLACAVCFAKPERVSAPAHASRISEKHLEHLSLLLRDKNSPWAYKQLSEIAGRKSSSASEKRAALALGHYDYQHGHFDRASKWLDRAQGDPVLGDYDLYWQALTNLALNHNEDALDELESLRKNFPKSVMTEQALLSLGTAAIAANQPAVAVAALTAYSKTEDSPQLLFLRGEAREKAGQLLDAAADYKAVYVRFPLSDQAREVEGKLASLGATLGAKLQPIPTSERLAHAAKLFEARDWVGARNEYNDLLPMLSGADLEQAGARILECGVETGADPSDLAARKIDDPDVDAERDYILADHYRSAQDETHLVAAVEAAAARAPSSVWTERAQFLAGNYYWVNLQRDRASQYYARLAKQFPSSSVADSAAWRVVWTAVVERQPNAAAQLQDHLQRFPQSQYTPDTLYWLGRLAEEAKNPAEARAYYSKLRERFAQTYFANLAAARMKVLGHGPKEPDQLLALIPALPAAMSLDDPPSAEADIRRARAAALESIAFDASAVLELRAAYAATQQPVLLLEAAQDSVAAEHYGAAIVLTRKLYPDLEARAMDDVPRRVWLAAYALPFKTSIRRWALRDHLDPMLVAGLIHQESAFEPKALSDANAVGLMQLLPSTARGMAHHQRVRFSRFRLEQPDYNVRLGTAYFATLKKQFDSTEEALAAYNAGADRVTQWTTGQTYREPAEFVESIPFTQTRNYVEIVERNAAIYRRLYRTQSEPRKIHDRKR